MIRETCSCGSTFEVSAQGAYEHATAVIDSERNSVAVWRANHRHAEPVAGTVLVDNGGPTLADVCERLDRIALWLAELSGDVGGFIEEATDRLWPDSEGDDAR